MSNKSEQKNKEKDKNAAKDSLDSKKENGDSNKAENSSPNKGTAGVSFSASAAGEANSKPSKPSESSNVEDQQIWITFKIATNHLQTELLEQELNDLGACGMETIDKKDFASLILGPDSLDYASGDFIESLPDVVNVRAFFEFNDSEGQDVIDEKRQELETKIKAITERLNKYLPEMLENSYDKEADIKEEDREENKYLGYAYLENKDWSEEWRKFYKPLDLENGIVICPSWIDYKSKTGDTLIRLDPGGAFGTGNHESTGLCLKELPDLIVPGCSMLDLGTGSGILSIAAQKLGAVVDAIDLDPNAIKVARQNCENNRVAVNLLEGSINRAPKATYDLIVTNICAEVLIELSEELYKHLAKTGYLLLSGFVEDEKKKLKKAFLKLGFEFVRERTDKEWVSYVFRHADKI